MKIKYLITILFILVIETLTNAQQTWQQIYNSSYNRCIENGRSDNCCKFFAKWMADAQTDKNSFENHPDRLKYAECIKQDESFSDGGLNDCNAKKKAIESSIKAYEDCEKSLVSLEELKNKTGGSSFDENIAQTKKSIAIYKQGTQELIDEYNQNCSPKLNYPNFASSNPSVVSSEIQHKNTGELGLIVKGLEQTEDFLNMFSDINSDRDTKIKSINKREFDNYDDGSDIYSNFIKSSLSDSNNYFSDFNKTIDEFFMEDHLDIDKFRRDMHTDVNIYENMYLQKAHEIFNSTEPNCEKRDKMNALQWELRDKGHGSELEKHIGVQGMDNTMKTILNYLDNLKLECEEYNKAMAGKWQAPRFNSDGTPTKNMEYLLNNSYPSNVKNSFNPPDMSGFFNEQDPKGELTTQTQKEIDDNILNSTKRYVYDQYSKSKTNVYNARQYVIDQIPSKEQVYKSLPKGLYGTTELTLDYTEKVQKTIPNIHNMSNEQIKAMEREGEKYREDVSDEASTGIWRWFK